MRMPNDINKQPQDDTDIINSVVGGIFNKKPSENSDDSQKKPVESKKNDKISDNIQKKDVVSDKKEESGDIKSTNNKKDVDSDPELDKKTESEEISDENIRKTLDEIDRYHKEIENLKRLTPKLEASGDFDNLGLTDAQKEELVTDPVAAFEKFSSDLKSKIKDLVKSEINYSSQISEKMSKMKDLSQRIDQDTFKIFPDLKNPKSELSKATYKEIEIMLSLDPEFKDKLNHDKNYVYEKPDLLYNASCRAFSKLVASGKIDTSKERDELIRRSKVSGSKIEGTTPGRSSIQKSGNYSDKQRKAADVLGLKLSIYDKK